MISIYFRIEILGIYEKYLGKLIRLKFSRYEILGYMKQNLVNKLIIEKFVYTI